MINVDGPKYIRIYNSMCKAIEKDDFFRTINSSKIDHLLQSIGKMIPDEQIDLLSDKELDERVKASLVVELLFGLLNDLSEDEIKEFKSATKRN